MIRAVIFDCFGVLQRSPHNHFIDEHISPNDYERAHELIRQVDYGLLSQRDFEQQIAELAGLKWSTVHHGVQDGFVRNDLMIKYIIGIRARGTKTALLSNISRGTMPRFFSNDELDRLFDNVVLSSEIGAIKPHPSAYQKTCEIVGLRPDETVMIDDTPENITGAEVVGMAGVLFRTNTQTMRDIDRLLQPANT